MIASHDHALKRPARHHLALATVATGLAAVIAIAAVSLADAAHAAGPPDIGLGTAGQFAVLASDGVTNTGTTNVTGLVGSAPTTSVADGGAIQPPSNVRNGPDLVVAGAKADLLTAYGQAAGAQTNTTTLSASDIGGQTLVGGTYKRAGSLGFTGTLTLDGENDPNSVFIIQVGADFTTATGASVQLTRGAQACHVYWQIGNDAVVEVDTAFKGNILAGNDISAKTRATFEGRLLTNDGAVTLDTNTITLPACTTPTTPAPVVTTPVPTNKPTPKATKKPTPKATKKPSKNGGRSSSGGDSKDSGGSDSDGSDGGTGTGTGTGSGTGSGGGTDGGSSSTPGLPNTGGPSMFLVPVGAVMLLAGAGLVAVSRRRTRGTHRA